MSNDSNDTSPKRFDAIAENLRIRNHLLVAEAQLRAADVSHLSPSQRAARQTQIETLQRYREAGQFPRNHEVPGRAPFFVDAQGTDCAVAHLIRQSGDGELVDAVAATRNNAYVNELADTDALLAWLDQNGLSVAEAALIQPTYDWERNIDPLLPRERRRPRDPVVPSPEETIPVEPFGPLPVKENPFGPRSR